VPKTSITLRMIDMVDSILDGLYGSGVLQLAANITRTRRLDRPDITVTRRSSLCGSHITIDVVFAGDLVQDYAQTIQACVLGQASAAVVGQQVIGRSAAEIVAVESAMRNMLQNGASPPEGDWSALQALESSRESPSRHGAILLPFAALIEAFDFIA